MDINTSVKRNAILNGIRQGSAILFPLITFPYISRTLMADNFGKVMFGLSIVSYFSLLAALGINVYAVREGARIRMQKGKLETLVNELYTVNILAAIIAYLLLFLFLFLFNNMTEYRWLIVVQSSVILFTTLGADWINTIFEDYTYLTIRWLVFQTLSAVGVFVFVREADDYLIYAGLVSGAVVGANIANLFYCRKHVRLRFVVTCHLKHHLKPIFVLFASSIALVIYLHSDTTMLGFMQGDDAVGIYTASSKIYSLSKGLVNAVIYVTVPRIAYLLGNNLLAKYYGLTDKIFKFVLVCVVPMLIGLFLLSEEIIYLLSGAGFIEGGVALMVFSPAILFGSLSCYFAYAILIPNKREKYFLYATITGAIANIGLNFWLIPVFSFNGAAITTLVSEILVCGISYYFGKDLLKLYKLASLFRSIVLGCVGVIVVCIMFKELFDSNFMVVACSVLASVLVYLGVLLSLKNEVAMIAWRDVKKRLGAVKAMRE